MKIAAHIGVKDEAELIERCIGHLRRIGVSQFIVCDMGSTDGTAGILERQRSDDFHIIMLSNREADAEWLRRNETAIRDIDADWLLFLDADEFPLPAAGSLHGILAGTAADLLSVPRYNVAIGPNGPYLPTELGPERYGEVELIVEAVADFRRSLAKDPDIPWIRAVPAPKIAVRPKAIGRLLQGVHDIVPAGPITRAPAQGLLIAHLALSTPERFRRKIDNIREFFAHHDAYAGPDIAWHWRRWAGLADRGEIDGEFARSVFSVQFLDALRRDGIVRSAAEMLRGAAP